MADNRALSRAARSAGSRQKALLSRVTSRLYDMQSANLTAGPGAAWHAGGAAKFSATRVSQVEALHDKLSGLVSRGGVQAPARAVQALLANKSIGLGGTQLQNAARVADAMRRSGGQPFQIVVQADWHKLAAALRDLDIKGDAGGVGLYRALNHTAAKVKTYLKRQLTVWVGANKVKSADDAIRLRHAGPGHLEAQVIVKDKYPSITAENFGAVWNRSMPGVQHHAWNRVQIARGAFMIPGRKPAFHRVGKDRFPIKPVFGPNYARETQRHESEVRGYVEGLMRTDFIARARHEIEREVARVKAKHGL